jgi:sugar (pentulose or hexulose) kinase
MSRVRNYLALDLGGSARCVVGSFDGQKLSLDLVMRVETPYVRVLDQVHWDVLALFGEVKDSLRRARQEYRGDIFSIGVDTCGVAFALLDAQGQLVGNPLYHRRAQAKVILEAAFERVPKEDIFRTTGLQLEHLNSLYWLVAMIIADAPALRISRTFLMLADLINYWLTGRVYSEYTAASTSHMLNARTKQWDLSLIEAMGISRSIFPEIIPPGQVIEDLHQGVSEETGLGPIPVVATAAHDSAAAVASVPATTDEFAFLILGTWGLLGAEVPQPILTEQVAQFKFTNKGGVFGNILLHYTGLGLWLVQECRRAWVMEGKGYTWAELIQMSEGAMPFTAYIDNDAPQFLLPQHMPRQVQATCRETGQPVPHSDGAIVRVILESLALKYRYVLDRLADILGEKPEALHILGGGGRNRLLCQFCANAINLPVISGPYEATCVGNILMQMVAMGDLASLEEGRDLVRESFPSESFIPADRDLWEEQYDMYLEATRQPMVA